MDFKKEFPNLHNFFTAYFPDADIMQMSDVEVVRLYKTHVSEQKLNQIKLEIVSLIEKVQIYWDIIGDEANRNFSSPEDAFHWLNEIKNEL